MSIFEDIENVIKNSFDYYSYNKIVVNLDSMLDEELAAFELFGDVNEDFHNEDLKKFFQNEEALNCIFDIGNRDEVHYLQILNLSKKIFDLKKIKNLDFLNLDNLIDDMTLKYLESGLSVDEIDYALENYFSLVQYEQLSYNVVAFRGYESYHKFQEYFENLDKNEYYDDTSYTNIGLNEILANLYKNEADFLCSNLKYINEDIQDFLDGKDIDDLLINSKILSSFLPAFFIQNEESEDYYELNEQVRKLFDLMQQVNDLDSKDDKNRLEKINSLLSCFKRELLQLENYVDIEKIKNKDENEIKKVFEFLEKINSISVDKKSNYSILEKKANLYNLLSEIGYDIENEKGYKKFQLELNEAVNTNLCVLGIYDLGLNLKNLLDGSCIRKDYQELSQKYIDNLVNKKTNIFSSDGRVLKNCISVIKMYPELDLYFENVMGKIYKSYELESVDLEKEEEYADDFIAKHSVIEDEKTFDEFLNHLQLIKLKNEDFILPQKYVNYIIKQALECDNVIDANPQKYLALVECAIEDLGKNDLKERIGLDKKINYFISDNIYSETLNSQAGGSYYNSSLSIKVSRKSIIDLIENKDLYALDTVFHENTHAEQYRDFENKHYLSYNRYVMQKEQILISEYSDFYRDNYDKTFIEIEANEKSAQKLGEYLDELNLSSKTQLMFLSAFGEKVVDMCTDVADKKKKEYDIGEEKRIDGKNQNIYEVFDNLIKEKPNLLKDYPEFELEYNSDGTRKSLSQLFYFAKKNSEEAQFNCISQIIKKGNVMAPESFISDMIFLMEESKIEDSLVFEIVSKNISSVIFKLMANSNQLSDSRVNDLRNMIHQIKNTVENNTSGAFARAMREKSNFPLNPDATGIDFLNMLDDTLSEKEKKLDSGKAEKDLFFLQMASDGIENEEIYKLEESIIQEEKKRIKRIKHSKKSKNAIRNKHKKKRDYEKSKDDFEK